MNWEFNLLLAIQKIRNPALDRFMRFLSKIGDKGLVWFIISGIFLFLPRSRKTGEQMLLSIGFTFLIGNLFLKNTVDRTRPYHAREIPQLLKRMPSDPSFPSGHTMNSFASATAIFCWDMHLGIPALVLAFAIAFSRLYNLVHFPTDVLAGIAIGTGVACAVCQFF